MRHALPARRAGRLATPLRGLRHRQLVEVAPDAVEAVAVRSAPDGTLLVFGTAPPVPRAALDAFRPSEEVSAPELVSGLRDDVVFPLHAEVLAERLAQ